MPIQSSPAYTAVSPNYLSDKQLDTLEIGAVITVLQSGEDTSQTNATNINNSLKKWIRPSHSLVTNWTAGYWSSDGANYANSPASQYEGYLYCDGSEYNIKDYPHLYFNLKNIYGGDSTLTINNVTSDGAIIQSLISGSQYLLYLKTDSSGLQVIPYDTAVVFSVNGAFNFLTTNITYFLAAPTSGSQTETVGGETTYIYRLLDLSQNNITGGIAKTKANISANQPTYKYSKNFTINDWPIMFGTFKVPDYKAKKLVGLGPVYGSGSPTIGDQVLRVGLNDEIGNSLSGGYGGSWYLDENAQKNQFSLGRVITTGMENVVDSVSASLNGQVSISIDLLDKPLAAAPEHNHVLFNSQANTDSQTDNEGYPYDPYLASYSTNRGAIDYFFPDGTGIQLSHGHGLVTTRITDPTIATFDNNDSSGVGSSYTSGAISILTRTSGGSGYADTGTAVSLNGGSGSGASISWSGGTSGQVPSTIIVASSGTGFTVGNTVTVSGGGNNATFTVTELVPAGSYYAGGSTLGYYKTETTTDPSLVKTFSSSSRIGGITITEGGSAQYANLATYNLVPSANPQTISFSGYALSEVFFALRGGGGSGGATTIDGNAGQNTSLTLGSTTIIAGGGGSGKKPSTTTSATGGAAGAAGVYTTPTVNGLYYQEQRNGNAGTAGDGGPGWIKNFIGVTRTGGAGGTAVVSGSNGGTAGTSKSYSDVTAELTYDTYTSTRTSSFTCPVSNANYTLLNVYYEIAGGSGGNGYERTYGGPGKVLKFGYNGAVNWCVGQAGSDGSYGTNLPAGGTGCTSAIGGSGGGGRPAGGSGGGGGSATILYNNATGLIIAGAGGGGGGGGYGADGDNTFSVMQGQPNGYSDAYAPLNQQIIFAGTGRDGVTAGCQGGGGGGGGGGVGLTDEPSVAGYGGAGGGGGGHGGGYGGGRGLTSFRADYVSYVSSGNNGSVGSRNGGYVKVTYTEDRSYWGTPGGGGGSGAFLTGAFTNDFLSSISATSLTVNVGYGGSQASSGSDSGGSAGGNGSAEIRLRVITGYTGGIPTPSVGDIVYDASDGIGNSTDASVTAPGSGINNNGGFNNGGYYCRFTGGVLERYIILNPVDTTNVNSITFRVARGNGNNGGELPDVGDDLQLYWGTSATSFPDPNFLGVIVPVPDPLNLSYDGTSGSTNWYNYTYTLSTDSPARDTVMYFKIVQKRSATGDNTTANTDNYGISQITFSYLPKLTTTFVATSGYLPSDISSKTYTVTGIGSGITVNDIKFNLTSSIRLTPTPYLQPNDVIPLVEKYHRVKYLIKAF